MGRITIFSANDILSHRVKQELKQKGLPYTEISFEDCPSRYYSVKFLSSCVSVPQVFFNTRHVGGLEETIHELQTNWTQVGVVGECTETIEEKYKNDIENHPLNNPIFDLPEQPDTTTATITTLSLSELLAPNAFELQENKKTTLYSDITEKLRNSLPFVEEYIYDGNAYMNCIVSGQAMIQEFQVSLQLSTTEAMEFAERLLQARVIYPLQDETPKTKTKKKNKAQQPAAKKKHLSTSSEFGSSSTFLDEAIEQEYDDNNRFVFENSNTVMYGLQCNQTPQILNSYCIWTASQQPPRNPNEVVQQLDRVLHRIELECCGSNPAGKLDHAAVRCHKDYPKFEESMCLFQTMDLSCLTTYCEKLAFALNVYNLMIRYAFIKMGIPTTDVDRLKLLSTIQFHIAGHVFTFQEWIDGILRGNSKTRFLKKKPFGKDDVRKHVLNLYTNEKQTIDVRIHFAIHMDPYFGSKSCVPFRYYSYTDAEELNKQLDIVASVYLEDDTNFYLQDEETTTSKGGTTTTTTTTTTALVAKPLVWYRCDFCNHDKELVGSLQTYLQGSKLLQLKKRIRQHPHNNSKSIPLKFIDLDCRRNLYNYLEFSNPDAGANHHKNNTTTSVSSKFKSFFPLKRSITKFQPPRMHPKELNRLTTLHDLNLLDIEEPIESIDSITNQVQKNFDVPLVLVSLVDEDRQWFLSNQWNIPDVPALPEAPREISFCGHAILGDDHSVFCIHDATKDNRFAENPLVAGDFHLRFYAGCNVTVPDTTTNGNTSLVNIGTLCLVDQKPRTFTEEEKLLLQSYAKQVGDEIMQRQEQRKRTTTTTTTTTNSNRDVPSQPVTTHS